MTEHGEPDAPDATRADVRPSRPPPRAGAAQLDGDDSGDGPSSTATYQSEDFLFHLYRGSELLQDNCIEEAKGELERALSLQPQDTEGQALLGVVYFRLGLYPRAIRIYEEIAKTHPREITPRMNLALCYLKTGQSIRARETLEEVIQVVPDHRRAWGYLGLVFERQGEYTKALAAFQRAEQAHMVRRLEQLLDSQEQASRSHDSHDSEMPARAELRQAAAEAMQELEHRAAEDTAGCAAAESNSQPPASLTGRWRAVELGEDPLPPPSRVPSTSSSERRTHARANVDDSLALSPSLPPREALRPSQIVQAGLLLFPIDGGVAQTEDGVVLVHVKDVFSCRLDAVVALLPEGKSPFKNSPVMRRRRGKETEEPIGGHAAPMLSFEGSGNLVLGPRREHRLVSMMLSGEFLYLREDLVVGFAGTLRYESGRMATDRGEHVPLTQLSGRGAVVLETRAPLHVVQVGGGRGAILRADSILGWTGRLLVQPASTEQAPHHSHAFVTFSGDGAILLDTSP